MANSNSDHPAPAAGAPMKLRIPLFRGLHAEPPPWLNIALALAPFILFLAIYLMAAEIRHQDNPQDKLLPTLAKIGLALEKVAVTPDARSGEILLWQDTGASLKRLVLGVGIASFIGFFLGLNMGLLPGIRGLSLPFLTFIANIPPLAILPILFITFGVDQLGKVMLIILGTFPLIARDIYLETRQIPTNVVVKALTLGASQFGVIYRVVMPQILPRLIDTVRLVLGAAWLFLIASEAIASQDGLGYRIFLVRRYLSMDIIIVYVLWITVLAYAFDILLRLIVGWLFPWYSPDKKD
jgi:NitT/TauT family transport system permease protein